MIRWRSIPLSLLVRRRHALSQLLRQRVAEHGRTQTRLASQRLIQEQPDAVVTSPALMFEMSESQYAPYQLFEGHTFPSMPLARSRE